jgi:hypothetical protein
VKESGTFALAGLLLLAATCPALADDSAPAGLRDEIVPGGGEFSPPPSVPDGYVVTIAYAQNNAPSGTTFAGLLERKPTRGESPITPHGDAVFFFSFAINATGPVTFASGTSVTVVFPQALDTSLIYSLTIGFADKPIGPIDAKAHGNTLQFAIPGFTVNPNVELMGEIDGDPP